MRSPGCWLLLLLVVAAPSSNCPAENAPFTIELELDGRRVEGAPLAWTDSDVMLLERDGHLLNFHPNEAKNYRRTSDQFISLPSNAMRARLKTEFGRDFDVSSTGHYLVVHPRGERDTWARRFEELYRSFMRYFTARSFEPKRPLFPLVAVVLHDEQEFHRYTQQVGAKLVPGTLGYYSPQSNRILLYDVTAGHPDSPNWQVNAETIIHEAIHQMAFNSGVHSRYSPPPRWIAEGLGTMFEARGVSYSDRFMGQSERINRDRLADFKKYATRRTTGSLADFVASDRVFQSSPEAAYAEAWALTFFLFETQAKRYVDYLQHTSNRPRFVEYRGPERLADFQTFFGQDLRHLEARYLRFIAGLK